MKFLSCVYRLESLGWCICRNATSDHPKCRVRPADCQGCRVREETLPEPAKMAAKMVAKKTPSQKSQEPPRELPRITSKGTLIYTRSGCEPPPCPPGYQRKSSDLNSDDAWILEPDKPLCKHTELKFGERGNCGYPRITCFCKLIGSFVGPRTCGICTRRNE